MSAMGDRKTRLRRRGVRASRVRLQQALAASGMRTQAALAERIADQEALDTAPRDLVNRAFREQPVDPQSLERIARALGVEAHTLYLRSEDTHAVGSTAGVTDAGAAAGGPGTLTMAAPAGLLRRPWPALGFALGFALALAAVVVITLFAWRPGDQPGPGQALSPGEQVMDPEPAAPPPSVALVPVEGDGDGALLERLRTALAADFRLTSPGAVLLVDQAPLLQAASQLDVDYVLGGALYRRGRYRAVQIMLVHEGSSRLLWADSFPANAPEARLEKVAADTARALGLATGRSRAAAQHFPGKAALADYLAGRVHLDRSRTELNVKRALTRFESALRRSPDYPTAHAGLCEALVQQSILMRERRFLEDAEQQCFRALQLDPGNVEALVAWGNVLRKTDRQDEAEAAFSRALAATPRHTDALLGLAELWLARHRDGGEDVAAAAALDYARQAMESDPGFWKAPYVYGRALYFTGDVDAAVAAVERAKALDANEHVLSNLGTFQFCRGDHAAARQNYLAAKQAAPEFYVGDVHLGVVNYFLGDYEEARRLFRQSIEQARQDGTPEDHRVWANLADAERHRGDKEAARQAYERAAVLAERDLAEGNAPDSMAAHLGYYYTALLSLSSEGGKGSKRGALAKQLESAIDGARDPDSLARLAAAFVLRGELEPARNLYARLTSRCQGFGAYPDLAVLR